VTPVRIQLSRAKGWRMPPNTVKVDRTTKWGNPFIVGQQGDAAECVYLLVLLHSGLLCVSSGEACGDRQQAYMSHAKHEIANGWPQLRGKNLACWCRIGEPCHGDLLLTLANDKRKRPVFDLDKFMARYGIQIVNGRAIRITNHESRLTGSS
jgi:hypothetical protein